MEFVSEISPPPACPESAWWFIFQGNRLLVRFRGQEATVPRAPDPGSVGLEMTRVQYLGRLDGHPCYSGECGPHAAPPDGLTFEGLRELFGSMDENLFWTAGRAIQIVKWDQKHQYCGRCGTATVEAEGERARVCPECGLKHFPRISPAVIVAVVRGEEILLARAHRYPKAMYSVLAGFVEPGETLEECLRREVREEVGLEVKDIRYFGSQPWPFPDSLMVAFTSVYESGDLRADGTEIADAGWFSAHDLPRIPDRISIARRLIDWFVENYG